MLKGVSLQAHPTEMQKLFLSRWMGCARFLWNAKCEEDHYLCSFAKRYLPIGTYAKVDQSFARYKNRDLSPWLFDCPSQILRNSATNWYKTYDAFLKGFCGKPKRKRKGCVESIHLTRELFRFEKCLDGVTRLRIGTKTRDLGFLSIKNHCKYGEPKSIYIKKRHGRYWVSFCFEDISEEENQPTKIQHLEYLRSSSREDLENATIGIDRGVVRPVQAGCRTFDFSNEQKRKKKSKERFIRRCQRRLSQQQKRSKRRNKNKKLISRAHEKIGNIRKDFCHKTSRSIVDDPDIKVIVLEDLKTSKMTKKPAPKKRESSKGWKKNNRRVKAGLNKSILDKGWHKLEIFLDYKAYEAGKALFKVPAHYTSQECADCGHTHSNNRKSQELFICEYCGHSENADRNAAEVIKKRAINLILDSGTELSERGVLLDSGRGAVFKTVEAKATGARSRETSKKKSLAIVA
jgi:putative transposase